MGKNEEVEISAIIAKSQPTWKKWITGFDVNNDESQAFSEELVSQLEGVCVFAKKQALEYFYYLVKREFSRCIALSLQAAGIDPEDLSNRMQSKKAKEKKTLKKQKPKKSKAKGGRHV